MMTPEELWSGVESNFSQDDGSLPCVDIQNLTTTEIGEIYLLIRGHSRVVSVDPCFWDIRSSSDRHIDEVSNAASLVTSQRAEPFYFAVEGVSFENVEIPCIGIQVFQDSLSFDYKMGSEWGPKQAFAFFSFLKALLSQTQHGTLVPGADGPPNPQSFVQLWNQFVGVGGQQV
ncbi:hypothetical protein Pan258_03550 [Symmachiella dynata]|uniref:hypothetical protein n=1 Tax=Symmachiella dynata TaxID=2527995 RepID=UPI0011891743|nr:hypothetical protein [Symmachiella dynata]QDT46337.1 hypothetical protein Pan258_03550 [Symmachiella dynata]